MLGNLIGTKKDGTGKLGNGFNGVDVSSSATGVSILGNLISFNGQLGIDLGVNGLTPNDLGDADTGANNLQNKPFITSAKNASGETTIKARLNSTPNRTFLVQFFSNPSNENEGKKFIGKKKVSTNSEGKASFSFSPARKVGAGKTITATATGSEGTSEFSAPRKVAS